MTLEWILQHVRFLVPAAAAVAYLLKQRQTKARGASTDTPRAASNTAEAAERTRRVQAEIRRKIAERRGQPVESPEQPRSAREAVLPTPRAVRVPPLDPFGGPVILDPFNGSVRRAVRRPEPEQPAEPREEVQQAVVLERQEKLAAEMRALEAARAASLRRAAMLATAGGERLSPAGTPTPFLELREQLGDPRQLRRAVILQEILGRPVALR